ncbi:MAG: YjfI family protein, partial [Thiohalomonadales bacterium]
LDDLAIRLIESDHDGSDFEIQPIPGEVDVLQIIVEQFDELPIYVSITDSQIICIVYLCKETDINPEKRNQMMESMLEMNIPVPLSSFAKVSDSFVIFGALSLDSSFEDIVHEITTLNENSIEAMDVLEEYFNE